MEDYHNRDRSRESNISIAREMATGLATDIEKELLFFLCLCGIAAELDNL